MKHSLTIDADEMTTERWEPNHSDMIGPYLLESLTSSELGICLFPRRINLCPIMGNFGGPGGRLLL